MEDQNIKCYIHNGTPNFKIHSLIEKCDNPNSLLSDDSKDEYRVVQNFIRETALEKAKQLVGQRPLGIFLHPEVIGEEIFNKCDELVENNIKNSLKYVEVEGPRFGTVKTEMIELPEELYFFNRDAEGLGIETGDVILRMIREFMQQGVWHLGFKNESGYVVDVLNFPVMTTDKNNNQCWIDSENRKCEPILWFGLDDEEPIDIWTLDTHSENSDWKSFWFNGFWYMDWNALFGGFDNYYTVWMFCECGMEEPIDDFDRVRNSCPIELNHEDNDSDLDSKIIEFAKSQFDNDKYKPSVNIYSIKQSEVKADSLRNAVYQYGYDYGSSCYADYPEDVDEILSHEEDYGILDICDSGPEIIGSGMLSEIECNDYFDKKLFSPDEYALDFYDLLDKYLEYDDISEAFDNGMTDAIKDKYGIEGFQKLYPGF